MPEDIITLPILMRVHADLTVEETHILVSGDLETGNAVRIPMTVETAMRLLKLLSAIREDKGFDLPDDGVQIDKLQ